MLTLVIKIFRKTDRKILLKAIRKKGKQKIIPKENPLHKMKESYYAIGSSARFKKPAEVKISSLNLKKLFSLNKLINPST